MTVPKFKSEAERQAWRKQTIDAIIEMEIRMICRAWERALDYHTSEYLQGLSFLDLVELLQRYGGPPPPLPPTQH